MRMIHAARRQLRCRSGMIAAIKPVRKNLVHDSVRIPGWNFGGRFKHGDLPVVFRHGPVFDAFPAQAVRWRTVTDGTVFMPNQKTVPNQTGFGRHGENKAVVVTTRLFVDRRRVQQLLAAGLGPDPQPNRFRQRQSVRVKIERDRRATGNGPQRTSVLNVAGVVAKSVPHCAPR